MTLTFEERGHIIGIPADMWTRLVETFATEQGARVAAAIAGDYRTRDYVRASDGSGFYSVHRGGSR